MTEKAHCDDGCGWFEWKVCNFEKKHAWCRLFKKFPILNNFCARHTILEIKELNKE